MLSSVQKSVDQLRERLRAAESKVKRRRQKAQDYKKAAQEAKSAQGQNGDEAACQQATLVTAQQKQL